jgi:hypothetical protein
MPWQKKAYDSLTSNGRIPFIDHDILCGAPYYCNPQAEPFYLPRQLTPPSVFPRLNAFVHALELFLAGLGLYLFIWALGLNRISRYFGGLVWMLNGFLVVWKLWPHSAAAWPLSWLLLSTFMLLHHSRNMKIWGVILAISIFLSFSGGHPQTTCMILIFVGTYALTLCAFSTKSLNGKLLLGCRWGIFAVLGIGLASFFLVPQFLCLQGSFAWLTRVEKPCSLFAFSRSDIVSFPGFFFPEIFGGFRSGELPLCDIVKALNPNELAGGYVCWIIPLLIFPVAFIRRRSIPFFYLWGTWALLSFMIALKLPLVVNLVEAIPVIGSIRLTRFIMFAGISLLIPSAYAIDSICRRPLNRRTLLVICLFLGMFAGISFCGAVGFRLARGVIIEKLIIPRQKAMKAKLAASPTLSRLTPLDFAKYLETTTVWYPLRCSFIASVILFAFLYGARKPEYAYAILTGAAVFELFCFGYGYTPSIPKDLHYPSTPAIDFLRNDTGNFRVVADGEKLIPPNVFSYYGIQDLRGYDAIGYPPYFELAGKTLKLDRSENAFVKHRGYLHPVCDMLGMKYLLSGTELPDAKIPWSSRFKRVFSGNGFYIYENTSVLPQIYLADKIIVEPSPQKQLEILDALKPGERIALIPSGIVISTSKGQVELIEKTDRGIKIKASLAEPGFLVISVLYLPGWKAEVNRQPAVLESTNYIFMGLKLPQGNSDIKLSYSPPGLLSGIGISFVSLLLCLLFLLCPKSWITTGLLSYKQKNKSIKEIS